MANRKMLRLFTLVLFIWLNVKGAAGRRQDVQSEANEKHGPPLPPLSCSPLLVYVFRSWCLNAVLPVIELRESLVVYSFHYVCTKSDPNPQTLPLAVKLLH